MLEVKDWILSRFGSRSIDFWSGIHLNDKGHRLLFDRVMAEQVPEYIETVTGIARGGGPR